MGAIRTGPGGPLAFSSASGGKIYAFNNITNASNTGVAPANPSRQSITFINPGASVTIYVSMVSQLTQAGIQSVLTPTTAALGGTIPILPGAVFTIYGECQLAWQALAASGGATNPLTVIDSNV